MIIGSNNDQVVPFERRVLKLFVTLRPAKCALGCFRIAFQTKQLFPSSFKVSIKEILIEVAIKRRALPP